jgi:hypothetical protein
LQKLFKLKRSFLIIFCITATFFRSQGWPLDTGLTVLPNFYGLSQPAAASNQNNVCMARYINTLTSKLIFARQTKKQKTQGGHFI